MNFYIEIDVNTLSGPFTLKCKNNNKCMVKYRLHYSPTVFYVQPPIVYQDSYSNVWFDPKSTPSLIKDLDAEELVFINAKIGGSLMDFEFNVDAESSFSHWNKNVAKGQVGTLPISKNLDISMMWETGKSLVASQQSTTCTFDSSNCYQVKSVPAIFGMSSNEGYTTGGQNFTVKGHGFRDGTIKATLDGETCVINNQ
jgi:hypothetical protein